MTSLKGGVVKVVALTEPR